MAFCMGFGFVEPLLRIFLLDKRHLADDVNDVFTWLLAPNGILIHIECDHFKYEVSFPFSQLGSTSDTIFNRVAPGSDATTQSDAVALPPKLVFFAQPRPPKFTFPIFLSHLILSHCHPIRQLFLEDS